jgi:superfamily II DNA or RNA helicase
MPNDRAGNVPDKLEGRTVTTPTSLQDASSRGSSIDFRTSPEVVRVVAEGERLAFGHLFNPTFAVETSLIDPLPHQRIAVYQHLLPQSRLRFLLADDAGAGKTIMASLYIREMLARRLVRRVLIVPPAGLVGNWESELTRLFSLPVHIAGGADARSGNPFTGPNSDLVIVSVDTLAGERMFKRLQEPAVEPYDLALFDECHKLAADRQPDFTIRKTDRYRLAEALAGVPGTDDRWSLPWHCHHLLLLSATPHMGKDFPYYALWRLVEPEALPTLDAFHAYPADARQHHFLRRTKEEMVAFDGRRIYPRRISDTLSFELTQGPASEQTLYDETTSYIQAFYNRARILNRSAARLAMSVFQRRLASSTYALLRSFERRLARLEGLIADIRSGKLTMEELTARQRKLDAEDDVLDVKTGDEETAEDGREENEVVEEDLLGGVVAVSLAELEAERQQVQQLLELARRVHAKGDQSKFDKLGEVLNDPKYHDEKLLIFTEHRDTLEFLVQRLEGIGFAGQVARIHGGLDYKERQEQVNFFRKPVAEGGALYLVGTDAAGEGINLQFCWLMVNYDIPWNPARLEQRMGRIHRYKQRHDPVIILNLLAGKTREGRVLKTLLDKLERIRRELNSDKVFDVVGRLFEGVSLRQYLERALTEEGADTIAQTIEGSLTKEQVAALAEQEKRLYGDGGDVKAQLPEQAVQLEREQWRRLLPGYVRRFVVQSLPLLELGLDGDPDGFFSLKETKPHALDTFRPHLEVYEPARRRRLTIVRPSDTAGCIFLHPGEPFFERLRTHVCERFREAALRGGIFVDPYAAKPYLFHLAVVSVVRQADPALPGLARPELVDCRLVGLKQPEGGPVEPCAVEQLLLLRGQPGPVPPEALALAARAAASRELAGQYAVTRLVADLVAGRRQRLEASLAERLDFVARGYDYQDAELAQARSKLSDKARAGDAKAKGDITKIRERQRSLEARKQAALAVLRREPELIGAGEVTFLAHALVVPTADAEDRRRHDADVEARAVQIAWAFEATVGATVEDVSTPDKATAAGLVQHPGFDLLSTRPGEGKRAVEVKGRAGDKLRSKASYEDGMMRAFQAAHASLNANGRMVVVFANKQPDAWETLVSAIIRAGFVLDGSWPIQTERTGRIRAFASAALSSSVWLVSKKRPAAARPGWDNLVLQEMRTNIHQRLRDYWKAGIRGPDFVWAATGPALEAYSKHPVVKKATAPGETMSVAEFLREVRRIVVDFVVGQVLTHNGDGSAVSGLDDLTTYYLLHRHDFGLEEAPIGPCILYAISCNLSDAALVDRHDLLARTGGKAAADDDEETAEADPDSDIGGGSGSQVKLKPWNQRKRKTLGYDVEGRPAALIDQAHRLLHLWKAGDVTKVDEYLNDRGLRRHMLFHQLLQALIELAPAGSEERSLLESISNHVVARGVEKPAQQTLPFDGELFAKEADGQPTQPRDENAGHRAPEKAP